MTDHFRKEVWELMGKRGREVDAFVSVSDYYAAEIRKKMEIRDEQLHTIHIGVDPDDYNPCDIKEKEPIIGFISRMCEENGLHILVDAFILLKKDPKYASVKLKITGGKTGDDDHFIRNQKKKIKDASIEEQVCWVEEFEGEERQMFFDSVAVVSVPVVHGEAFGLYQLEALASGIPMVQPALGAFPEVVVLSRGGLVYTPNSPEQLAESLKQIILDREKLAELSRLGLEGVREHFDIKKQAEKLVEVYERVVRS